MPELPEVEAARKDAERRLKGRRIVEARCRPDPIMLAGVSPRKIEKALLDATVTGTALLPDEISWTLSGESGNLAASHEVNIDYRY